MEGKKESKISKSKIFFALALSFLLGIFSASFLPKEGSSWADFGFESIILIFVAVAVAIFVLDPKNKKTIIAATAILFFTTGMWRVGEAKNIAREELKNSPAGPAEFFGRIVREPEIGEKYQKLTVESKEPGRKKQKILINADIYPSYNFGDKIKISCILQEPQNFGDSRFDYQMYLAKDHIYRICVKPKLVLVAKNSGSNIYAAILGAKNSFEKKISMIFPDPEGAYLKGLLLGGSKRMTEQMNTAFSRTGTTHTVAVSGYNVTIVAAFLMWLGIFLGLWRQQVFSFALIGIVLFVLMTGAPSSAVRAGIMGSLVIWAMKEGRLANSAQAILAAGSLMLAVNPLLLRYDAGFQLSFLATLGIVWLYPLFEKNFFGGEQNILKETILMTLAAQLFVLPIILSNFENISLISPAVNLLILPAIPYIMLGGFAAGLAGFIFLPFAKIIGFTPYVLLKFELLVVRWFANFSWSSIEIKNFGWIYVTVYYFLLAMFIYLYQNKKPKKVSGFSG